MKGTKDFLHAVHEMEHNGTLEKCTKLLVDRTGEIAQIIAAATPYAKQELPCLIAALDGIVGALRASDCAAGCVADTIKLISHGTMVTVRVPMDSGKDE